jgi:hypothetical protein
MDGYSSCNCSGKSNCQTLTILRYLLLQVMPGLNIIPMKKTNTMMKEHCSTNSLKKYYRTCKTPGKYI